MAQTLAEQFLASIGREPEPEHENVLPGPPPGSERVQRPRGPRLPPERIRPERTRSLAERAADEVSSAVEAVRDYELPTADDVRNIASDAVDRLREVRIPGAGELAARGAGAAARAVPSTVRHVTGKVAEGGESLYNAAMAPLPGRQWGETEAPGYWHRTADRVLPDAAAVVSDATALIHSPQETLEDWFNFVSGVAAFAVPGEQVSQRRVKRAAQELVRRYGSPQRLKQSFSERPVTTIRDITSALTLSPMGLAMSATELGDTTRPGFDGSYYYTDRTPEDGPETNRLIGPRRPELREETFGMRRQAELQRIANWAGEMLGNIPSSAKNLARSMVDIPGMVDAAADLGTGLAHTFLVPEFLHQGQHPSEQVLEKTVSDAVDYLGRYKKLDTTLDALQQDPLSVAADLTALIPGAQVAHPARAVAAGARGATRGAGRVAGMAAAQALGATTRRDPGNILDLYRAGRARGEQEAVARAHLNQEVGADLIARDVGHGINRLKKEAKDLARQNLQNAARASAWPKTRKSPPIAVVEDRAGWIRREEARESARRSLERERDWRHEEREALAEDEKHDPGWEEKEAAHRDQERRRRIDTDVDQRIETLENEFREQTSAEHYVLNELLRTDRGNATSYIPKNPASRRAQANRWVKSMRSVDRDKLWMGYRALAEARDRWAKTGPVGVDPSLEAFERRRQRRQAAILERFEQTLGPRFIDALKTDFEKRLGPRRRMESIQRSMATARGADWTSERARLEGLKLEAEIDHSQKRRKQAGPKTPPETRRDRWRRRWNETRKSARAAWQIRKSIRPGLGRFQPLIDVFKKTPDEVIGGTTGATSELRSRLGAIGKLQDKVAKVADQPIDFGEIMEAIRDANADYFKGINLDPEIHKFSTPIDNIVRQWTGLPDDEYYNVGGLLAFYSELDNLINKTSPMHGEGARFRRTKSVVAKEIERQAPKELADYVKAMEDVDHWLEGLGPTVRGGHAAATETTLRKVLRTRRPAAGKFDPATQLRTDFLNVVGDQVPNLRGRIAGTVMSDPEMSGIGKTGLLGGLLGVGVGMFNPALLAGLATTSPRHVGKAAMSAGRIAGSAPVRGIQAAYSSRGAPYMYHGGELADLVANAEAMYLEGTSEGQELGPGGVSALGDALRKFMETGEEPADPKTKSAMLSLAQIMAAMANSAVFGAPEQPEWPAGRPVP